MQSQSFSRNKYVLSAPTFEEAERRAKLYYEKQATIGWQLWTWKRNHGLLPNNDTHVVEPKPIMCDVGTQTQLW